MHAWALVPIVAARSQIVPHASRCYSLRQSWSVGLLSVQY